MTDFEGGTWYPERRVWNFTTGAPHIQQFGGVDHLNEQSAWMAVVQAPATGTITGLRVFQGLTLTGGAPPVVRRWSLQGVTTAGEPDGVLHAQREIAVAEANAHEHEWWQPLTASDGTWAVTKGDFIAIVLDLTVDPVNHQMAMYEVFYPGTAATAGWWGIFNPDTPGGTPVWHTDDFFTPVVALVYHDGPSIDVLPGSAYAWGGGGVAGSELTTEEVIGMAFTVPVDLRCTGICFAINEHHATPGDLMSMTLRLSDATGTLAEGLAVRAGGSGSYDSILSFDERVLRPGVAYTATIHAAPGTPIVVPGFTLDLDFAGDFEGGPTWQAIGPSEVLGAVNRLHFYLHVPGTAVPEEPEEPVCIEVENDAHEVLTFGIGRCASCLPQPFFPILSADSERRRVRVGAASNLVALIISAAGDDLVPVSDLGPLEIVTTGWILSKHNAAVFGHYLGWSMLGTDAPFRVETVEMEYAATRPWDAP